MKAAWIGVYWTLPVNRYGFRDVPTDVDAAAERSLTIRYQRARVRAEAAEAGAELLDEIAFVDMRPDRATDIARSVLEPRLAPFRARAPALVRVALEAAGGWRPNPFLAEAASFLGLRLIDVAPDAIALDGTRFDPPAHFDGWRKRDRDDMARLRAEAAAGMREALAAFPAGRGRWARIAAWLNDRGTRTPRGGLWTAENVRKAAAD